MNLLCRLCLSTESLTDLITENDCHTSLTLKIDSCTNIKILPDDGLPKSICSSCKKKIKKFYKFKEKCLKVDLELRSTIAISSVDDDAGSKNMCYDFSDADYLDNSFKKAYNFYSDEFIQSNIVANNKYGCTDALMQTTLTKKITKNNVNRKEAKEKLNSIVRLQCELCGCIFETKIAFKKHLTSHSGAVKLYQCKLCPKRFTRAENKIIHMRSHMGIRPFICDICGQASTKRQDLVRHMKIHSDEKMHACPNCGRRFKRSGDVYTHMRTHTGARPYKCRYCEKDYTSHSGLRKHYKTHS